MPKFIVEYSLSYEHIVRVGVTAANSEAAEAIAMAAFDEATIWDNTPDMPLLYDDYEETDDNTLMFTAVEVDEWPEKGGCVKALERREAGIKKLAEARALLIEMQSAIQAAWDLFDDDDHQQYPAHGQRLHDLANLELPK